jgi:hypothetical protein
MSFRVIAMSGGALLAGCDRDAAAITDNAIADDACTEGRLRA